MSRPREGAAPYPRLVGDIGGTHLRFGYLAGPRGGIVGRAAHRWSDVVGLQPAIDAYLEEHGLPRPRAAALSIAAPVSGDTVRLVNRNLTFSIAELQGALEVERLEVLNDFSALALAVPLLEDADSRQIGPGIAAANASIAILGPGTGLGVSASIATPAGRSAVASEGGHASAAGSDEKEDRLLAILRERHGHVSFERVLSGEGIVNLYRAHCTLAGIEAEPLDAAAIAERAASTLDACCRDAVDRFFAFLGTFAGNLALTFDARGGVLLAGGIVPRLIDRIETSSFRSRFESKGRFRSYLERIPTRVILDPSGAALRGANQVLEDPGRPAPACAPEGPRPGPDHRAGTWPANPDRPDPP
jgi:glucokinase